MRRGPKPKKTAAKSASGKLKVWVCDDDGVRRESFSLGETVFVEGRGLSPSTIYEIAVSQGGKRAEYELLARYTTDRHGTLRAVPVLVYLGLFRDHQARALTFEEAAKASGGTVFQLRLRSRRKMEQVLKLSLKRNSKEPAVFSSDPDGRLQTGLEQGQGIVSVLLRNFTAGCVRVYMVPRQFGWRIGDAIEPVRGRDGAGVVNGFSHDGSPSRIVRLGDSQAFETGSYQFIVRTWRPGWYLSDELRLLPGDLVSDRRFASLVIRQPFKRRFGYDNGIVLTPQIAGRPLAHRPYFHFVNNFPKGTDVYAALDPDALPAGLVSQRAAIYVIQHKTAAEWSNSNVLTDISGAGMTAAPKVVPIVPGCVNWNSTLVWPNPQVPGQYDVAIDFGNNAANPQDFATDGTLDAPLDMIDGYVRVGFYVTEDPGLPGPYAGGIGQHDYSLGSIQVPSTDAGPVPTDTLPLTATVRYPAQASGVDAQFAAGTFPLIVIMHGNSGYDNSYEGYNYLLAHLASQGFIAMSIYAPVGVMIETRARAILAHLGIMAQNNSNPGLFQGHIDFNKVGIGGHSRGGEAVVRAARINAAEGLGWHIRAGVSLAPTDYHHYGDAGVPLLVIYGSNDGDVAGTWPDRTCFNIYDETGRPRSFVFVYGATHDYFNTVWAPTALSVESDIAPSDVPHLISQTDHENVAKGYFTAFMQAHLLGRAEQLEYFAANLKPSALATIQIHTSHQEAGTKLLDNFEQHDPGSNTLGGAVTGSSLSALAEDALHTLDNHSPHVTSGGDIAWQSAVGIYLSRVPNAAKDVSGFEVLAFRATQKYASPENPANQAQDFFVRLTDGGGKSRAIRASTFTELPYPYVRGYTELIKSAMKSVRVPLASYTIANLGQQDVDLTNIASISFEFDANSTGEIEVDDIEFSS